MLPASPLSRLNRGSDWVRTFTYDFSDFSNLRLHERQEIVDPLPLTKAPHRSRYSMSLTQIPEEQWEEVALQHTNGESLRQLAKVYGVSHEAVRQVLKRVEDAPSTSDYSNNIGE